MEKTNFFPLSLRGYDIFMRKKNEELNETDLNQIRRIKKRRKNNSIKVGRKK